MHRTLVQALRPPEVFLEVVISFLSLPKTYVKIMTRLNQPLLGRQNSQLRYEVGTFVTAILSASMGWAQPVLVAKITRAKHRH